MLRGECKGLLYAEFLCESDTSAQRFAEFMRILIADDSDVVRRAVRGLLAETGWQVCGEACDGIQTLKIARAVRPDMVLLDINMPGRSGLQTARELRQEIPGITILIMSLHDSTEFLSGALDCGADGCIDKAELVSDLVETIRKHSKTPVAAASPAENTRPVAL
jgi:DNA-binding NarL/FixJ family response regulator